MRLVLAHQSLSAWLRQSFLQEASSMKPSKPLSSAASVEEQSLSLFKSERTEDLVAIGLAALLVLAVLLGVRV